MKNLSHQPNNAKKKGKNRNNNNPGPGGNNPQQNHPTRGNQNPQGGNNNNQPLQGKKNNLITNFPCTLCGEYGHYTHHFPQIVDYKWMKASMNTQHPLAPPAPQPVTQHYLKPPPPTVLQNPIPHQGVMNTQQEGNPIPPKMGQYQNPRPNQPRHPVDCSILLTIKEEILLQKHNYP
jgi:hypothetical protein